MKEDGAFMLSLVWVCFYPQHTIRRERKFDVMDKINGQTYRKG